MTIENTPSACSEFYPEWIDFYYKGLQQLEEVKLTVNSSANVFKVFGDEVLDYIAALATHGRDRYGPTIEWNLPYYREQYETSALTDPTVYPVVQEVLKINGLWVDDAIKVLVLKHLQQRRDINLFDIVWMEKYFFDKFRENGSFKQAEDLIYNLADASQELIDQRRLYFAQSSSIEGVSSFNIPPMSPGQWQQFLTTPMGLRLATFSTVEFFLEPVNPKTPRFEILSRVKSMIVKALGHYQEDQDYQQFTADPYPIIAQAVTDFLSSKLEKGTGPF